MNIVIPLAGKSSRFFNEGFMKPKFLLPLHDGRVMIEGATDTLHLKGNLIFIVQKEHCEKYQINTFLKEKYPDCTVTYLDHYTGGCVESVFLACRDYINNSQPLVISNCDQFLEWDSREFMNVCNQDDTDGCVLTYYADTVKNSYIKLDENGLGTELREKVVISNDSLVGVHYWKRGSDFIDSALDMINNNVRDNGEYYVSISYNYLIQKGMKIRAHPLKESETYHTIGLPETYYNFINSKLPIQFRNLSDMTRGWLIGDFEPCILKRKDFEIAIMDHKKGELSLSHVHKVATEYNVLLSGKMTINNIAIETNIIFIIPNNLLTKAVFLEDSRVLCIKTPSLPSDKYCY
jgi:dTDP-glucose pyrophosphorylase